MRGTVSLHAGIYRIAPHVWFEVRQTDAGTELLLCDDRIDVEYAATVDERGEVVHGGVRPHSGPDVEDFLPSRPTQAQWVQVKPPELRINAMLRAAAADPLRCFPAHAKHRFTIRFSPATRDRGQAWPMAGYEGDGGTYIFYRRPNGPRQGERLLKVTGSANVALADDTDADRLPSPEWERFFHLPAGKHFTLNGRSWRKMSVADVAAAVGGRVFACWPE